MKVHLLKRQLATRLHEHDKKIVAAALLLAAD